MNRKGKSFKQTGVLSEKMKCFAVSTITMRVQRLSFGTDTGPQSFCHWFIALSMIRCLTSAQKSAVQVCLVATVAMETTQLVLSQFKNFYRRQWIIE